MSTIETILNHSRHHLSGVNRIITVLVSNGVVSATYQATSLLGGGLKACVDTQEEYDRNTREAAVQQFKIDCALAIGLPLYNVDAGNYYHEDGECIRNSKYCDSFATLQDAIAEIESNNIGAYPYCVIEYAGKETNYSDIPV